MDDAKQDPLQVLFTTMTRYARHHEGCGSRAFDPGHECRCGFNRAYADALWLATSHRPQRLGPTKTVEAAVKSHRFVPLRWWDRFIVGRCRHCYVPREKHPTKRLQPARPLGDYRRPNHFLVP